MDDEATDYRHDERIPLLPVSIFAGGLCAMIAYALVVSSQLNVDGPPRSINTHSASE